jgi:hypothetical protein
MIVIVSMSWWASWRSWSATTWRELSRSTAARGESHPVDRDILLDRAWGKVRVPARRVRRNVSADPQLLCRTIVDERTDPERVAVNRVALAAARDSLARSGPGYVSLVRAWNTAVSLIDKDDRDAGERVQLKYARRVLRRCASPDLVA